MLRFASRSGWFVRASLARQCATSSSNKNDEVILEHLSGKDEGVAVFSFNRPKVNAIGRSLVKQLEDAIDAVQHDRRVRVVVMRSLIPGFFCAGADLKERATMAEEDVGPAVARTRNLLTSLSKLPMPIIAAIDGVALGGGLEIALSCDFRVASSSARMGLTETKLAIIPGAGGTQRLPRLVGVTKAKELIFTGRHVFGEEAHSIGLVDRFAGSAEGGAFECALELAQEIIPQGPIAVRMAKQAIDGGIELGMDSALLLEKACYAQVIPTKDRLEGLRAFKEKRPPQYRGE